MPTRTCTFQPCPLRIIGLLLSITLLPAATGFAVTSDEVTQALYTHLLDQHPNVEPQIRLNPLPAFVTQAPCSELDVSTRGLARTGNLHAQLRCRQPRSWAAYVSAAVTVLSSVVTACRSLPRKHQISSDDLCLEQRPLSGLSLQVLQDPQDAIGKVLKRPLAARAALYRAALTAATTVTRGQTVSIEAHRGMVRIATQGKALADGRNGEQIQVQNLRSGAKLAAWVLAPGRVSTRPPGSALVYTHLGATAVRAEKSAKTAKVHKQAADMHSKTPALAAD